MMTLIYWCPTNHVTLILATKRLKASLGIKTMESAEPSISGTLGAIIESIAATGTNSSLPGVGLIASGTLAVALAGAGVSSLTGGLVSALVGSGISEERALECEEELKRGGVLMIITPRNDEDAEYFENEWRNYRGEHIYR